MFNYLDEIAILKKDALKALKGNWIAAVVACCIMILAIIALKVIGIIMIGMMLHSVSGFFLKMARNRDKNFRSTDFFKEIITDFVPGIKLSIIVMFIMLFWALIPIFIYTLVGFTAVLEQNEAIQGALRVAFVLSWALPLNSLYKYSQIFFILQDNKDMPVKEILKKSTEMMKGNKGKLIAMDLSFSGWILVGVMTLGLALNWVIPYIIISRTVYYQVLIGEHVIEKKELKVREV